ncbi:MAG: LacI family DNA-binding transcriptional regulator, partial [Armatimonadota bacterium]|nr:LacI family DNA-binding transcriptional regulator [Armatimonadota bacterium]
YASAATRERVRRAAEELNYRPNRLARALVQGRSRMLGVLAVRGEWPPFQRAVSGVEDEASEAGYGLLLRRAHLICEKDQQHLHLFADSRVEGIVAISHSLLGQGGGLLAHRPPHTPLVSINQQVDAPDTLSILMRNREAGRMLTEHLLKLGHRRVVYLDAPGGTLPTMVPQRSALERRAGYEEAMCAAGLAPRVARVPFAPPEQRVAAAEAYARDLLAGPAPPTAIFAVTDVDAVGVLRACYTLGWRVPDDLALAGFDDLDVGRWSIPPITTVRQPFYEAGRLAVRRLLSWQAGSPAEVVWLDCEILIRESSGSAKPRKTGAPG